MSTSVMPVALCVLMFALFAASARVPVPVFVTAALSFGLMAAPGIYLLRRRLAHEPSKLNLVILGAALGLGLMRLALVIFTFLTGASFLLVAIVTAISMSSVVALFRGQGNGHLLDVAERTELFWISVTIVVILVPITIAYSAAGSLTPSGYVYVSYFNHDFLHHVSIVAELSRGMPPENPYFAGVPLHYYWFFHVWPAFLVQLTGGSAREALSATVPFTVALFVACLAVVTKGVAGRGPRFASIALGFLAPGYVGVLAATREIAPTLVDRIPKYFTGAYSLLSHSWFRDALYEPHAMTALTLLLIGVHLHHTDDRRSFPSGLLVGFALAAALFSDVFIGAIGVGWYGVVGGIESVRNRGRIRVYVGAVLAVLCMVTLMVTMRAIPVEGKPLGVGPHPVSLLAPLYLIVDGGPLYIFGVTGIALLSRHRLAYAQRSWLVLLIVSLSVGFLVVVPNDPNLVLRKGFKVAQLPLVVFAAYTCGVLRRQRRKRLSAVTAWLAVLVGSVTLITDLVHYAMPTRPYTEATYVTREEMALLDWVRRCTPKEAVFQDVSEVRPGRVFKDTFYSLIVALGERRSLWGSYHQPYVLRVPVESAFRRREVLEQLFRVENPSMFMRTLGELPLDFIYANEREPGPHKALRTLRDAGLLREAKCIGPVCVFHAPQMESRRPGGRPALC